MKLTLDLINEGLEKYHGILALETSSETNSWYQAVWYNPALDMEEDFLLFGVAEDFPANLTGRGLISMGKPPEVLFSRNDILYFDEALPPAEIYSAIQTVFMKYHKWEASVLRTLRDSRPLEEMFQLAADVFENSVFMHNENFYLLVSVNEMPGQAAWEYDAAQGGYVLPFDVLNDFKVNKDYLATMPTRGPSIFPADTFGYNILYQNLWYNGKYRGRICVNELGRKIRPGDFYLLDYFSKLVIETFKVGEQSALKHTLSLSRLLIRLIEEDSIDSKTIDKILMQYGWTTGDDYFCVCLFPEERDNRTNSVQYICSRLSEEFPNTCAFSYEKCIVVLVNSTLSEMTIPLFRSRIAVMLREGLMKAGISSTCNNLAMFRYYYRQAICAFETGRYKQDTFWCYCFDDYHTDYILRNALMQFPVELLCSREILLLEDYDKDHTSELSRTLKIYLEHDRNLARTAEILDIHRSTLLYRIDRIKEITQLGFEQPEERFRLWLSYRLLDASR